jgi:hypothetical protein
MVARMMMFMMGMMMDSMMMMMMMVMMMTMMVPAPNLYALGGGAGDDAVEPVDDPQLAKGMPIRH